MAHFHGLPLGQRFDELPHRFLRTGRLQGKVRRPSGDGERFRTRFDEVTEMRTGNSFTAFAEWYLKHAIFLHERARMMICIRRF
jgi:hypothetical protein